MTATERKLRAFLKGYGYLQLPVAILTQLQNNLFALKNAVYKLPGRKVVTLKSHNYNSIG